MKLTMNNYQILKKCRIFMEKVEFIKQIGYSGKGCGSREQGTHVPIDPNMQGMTNGLGYSPFDKKKENNKPSSNINTITKNSSKPTLTLAHPKLIETSVLNCYHLQEKKKPSINFIVISQKNNDFN
jgi:hypothetical protein